MSILIAVPCYGGNVTDQTTMSLFNLGKLLVRSNIPHGIITVANESLISVGRSRLANFFLQNTEFEKLLFVDADVGFDPESVLKLYNSDKDIVLGSYPMKSLPIQHSVNFTEDSIEDNEYVSIDGAGIGFCMIRRNVFERIIDQVGAEIKYKPGHNFSNIAYSEKEINNSYHFFSEFKKDDTYLSEDKSFFMRAKACGVKIWLDRSIDLTHTGSHIFRNNQ